MSERTLFSERDIAERVREVAAGIAARQVRPDIAAPVLVGGFVFAADLIRELARHGIDLHTEFLWLRSYGRGETPGLLQVLHGPTDAVRNRNVLLIDGVLDRGATLAKAKNLLENAGSADIISAVAVVKTGAPSVFAADYALFQAGPEFLFGYGMDAAGHGRGLPDIRVRE